MLTTTTMGGAVSWWPTQLRQNKGQLGLSCKFTNRFSVFIQLAYDFLLACASLYSVLLYATHDRQINKPGWLGLDKVP